ncbi:MAG: hypothetical protein F4210_12700 [Holophagales bacterium]|nr:hypothetical protein [Holophagales bacterium]
MHRSRHVPDLSRRRRDPSLLKRLFEVGVGIRLLDGAPRRLQLLYLGRRHRPDLRPLDPIKELLRGRLRGRLLKFADQHPPIVGRVMSFDALHQVRPQNRRIRRHFFLLEDRPHLPVPLQLRLRLFASVRLTRQHRGQHKQQDEDDQDRDLGHRETEDETTWEGATRFRGTVVERHPVQF